MIPLIPPSGERLMREEGNAFAEKLVGDILKGVGGEGEFLLGASPHVDHQPPDLRQGGEPSEEQEQT